VPATKSSAVRILFVLVAFFGAANRVYADICIGVHARFAGRAPSALLLETMAGEVSSIWSPYGVRIVWLSDPADGACEGLNGSFDVIVERHEAPVIDKSDRVVLGRTRVRLDPLDRYPIHIDYDATERMIGALPVSRMNELAGHVVLGSGDMGRALGRVLAHEIGHVLLAAPDHQPRGLMRAHYLSDDLIALRRTTFTLSKGEIARLRSRERVLRARSESPSS
jgi:hypothetical protein